MNEETGSVSSSITNKPQYLCGDIVIHPNRRWPWLGTIHPKAVDFARVCSNCGGLCVTLDFSQSQLDIPVKCEMTTCGNCGEETLKPTTGDELMGGLPALVNSASQTSPFAEKNLNNPTESTPPVDKIFSSNHFLTNIVPSVDELNIFVSSQSTSAKNAANEEKNVGKKWQVNWFPAGDVTDVDGSEVVIIPFKQRSLFQEGNPVAKKDKPTAGLVKQVHRWIDAFILPDCKRIICDIPSERLFPVSPVEQSPGCYVIYKGWVGTIFNVFNRIYFRLDDGTEFYVNDDENERICAHLKEADKQSCYDMHQVFPGQTLKIRWCVLERAVWGDGRTETSSELKQKINKSRENFSKEGNSSRKFTCDDEQLEMEFRDKFGADSANFDTSLVKKVAKDFIETVVNSLSGASSQQQQESKGAAATEEIKSNPNDDWTDATVVKIEPIKIDVEWISQVISDSSLSEISMKTNYIEGDEVKNVTAFRACRAYESFETGSRYKCDVKLTDRIVTSEKWRRKMLSTMNAGELVDDVEMELDEGGSLSFDATSIDCAYVSVARSTTKIDILWEDGVFETNVDPSELSAQYAHPVDRDYFPAMYVLLQGGAAQQSSTNDDGDARKKSSNAISPHPSSLPGRFGVIRSARNAEKYATVDWFDYNNTSVVVAENCLPDLEPTKVKTEDVSFYDLKFFHEFNYVSGTLVSLIKPRSMSVPNVGYVRRKNPDGTVLVIWYDGREEVTFPWKLKQLNTRMFYSDYSPSETGNEHYYSPTEQEYEDLEDFRYYDYSSLSESQRHKRVALIVTVLQEVIPRLVRAIVIAFKYYSSLDRKKFVKLTLSTNDVTNGFAHMMEFRDSLKDIYDNESDLLQKQTKNASWSNRNIFRDEKLVWQCANWLYDWTEAMSTLQEDIRKDQYRLLMMQKNSMQNHHRFSSKPDAKRAKTENVAADDVEFVGDEFSASDDDDYDDDDENDDKLVSMDVDDPLSVELIELLHSIETGLSTVTGILAVPSTSDVTTGLILEYVNNCRKENSSSSSTTNRQPIDNNNVTYADLTSSHTFLLKLVSNSNKSTRLPCFSFAHRSDQDLSDLRAKWKIQSLKSGRLKRANEQSNAETNSDEEINAQIIVDRVVSFMESVLSGKRDISCRDDDVLTMCHEIADGMCLSVLSVLNSVVHRIGSRLSTDVAKLFETPPPAASAPLETASTSTDGDSIVNCSVAAAAAIGGRLESLSKSIDDDHASVVVHGCFEVMPNAPLSHRFLKKTLNEANLPKSFLTAIRREMKLLQTSLPAGIYVKTYEDRMDLFSCMIVGPQGTPYADGLFFFDVRLRDDYPNRPPHVFFKSMCKSLNPNLYEDGMVCLSLLGTWDGKEMELWTPTSTLLQVFVSIQSLILVSEPYFNEPGYEKEKGSSTGAAKSRDYNESAVLRTLESMKRCLACPPEPFRPEVLRHIKENGPRLMKLLDIYQQTEGDNSALSFPLFPVTQGFCLCIKRHAATLLEAMENFVNEDNNEKNKTIV